MVTPELLRAAPDPLSNPEHSITSIARLLSMSPGALSNHIPDLRELRVQPTGGGAWALGLSENRRRREAPGGRWTGRGSAVHQSANGLPLRVGLCAGAFDVGDVALGPFPDGTQGCQQ